MTLFIVYSKPVCLILRSAEEANCKVYLFNQSIPGTQCHFCDGELNGIGALKKTILKEERILEKVRGLLERGLRHKIESLQKFS